MRKTLHSGDYRLEILDKDDTLLSFRDLPGAVAFLRHFKGDPRHMAIMRETVAAYSSITRPLNPDELIDRMAELLVRGQVKVLRTFEVRPGHAGETTEEAQGAGGSGRPPVEKSWIEIYLRDMEGQPIPGKKYRIKLPEGTIEEGTLDSAGHAERYGINKGTCQVCFPEYDSESWERIAGP